jgi:hypothetical protein
MTKLLQDVWILADSGIVLFHRVFDKNLDANLFGGMLSALNSFAEEITSSKGLSNFELADKIFVLIKRKNYVFIANAAKKHKIKKLKQELEALIDKFFQNYPEEVLNMFNGDVSLFYNFKKIIEESLVLQRLEEAFW